MGDFLRLTCTIPNETFYDDEIFVLSYFPTVINERHGQFRKYYSIVTRNSYPSIIETLERELNNLGITDYSFNISTDYSLKSIKK